MLDQAQRKTHAGEQQAHRTHRRQFTPEAARGKIDTDRSHARMPVAARHTPADRGMLHSAGRGQPPKLKGLSCA